MQRATSLACVCFGFDMASPCGHPACIIVASVGGFDASAPQSNTTKQGPARSMKVSRPCSASMRHVHAIVSEKRQ